MGYLILFSATSAKFERKPIYWILSEVAKRLGDDVHQRFTEGVPRNSGCSIVRRKWWRRSGAAGLRGSEANGHLQAQDRTATSSPIATSGAILKRIRSKPHPQNRNDSSRLAEIAARWQLEKDELSARCRSTPPHLKAGTIRCAASIRCSCFVSTIKRAPIPATATLMCTSGLSPGSIDQSA